MDHTNVVKVDSLLYSLALTRSGGVERWQLVCRDCCPDVSPKPGPLAIIVVPIPGIGRRLEAVNQDHGQWASTKNDINFLRKRQIIVSARS
jgi:hypothetical protein